MALNSALRMVIWAGVREKATASNISFLKRDSRMNRPKEFIWVCECVCQREGGREGECVWEWVYDCVCVWEIAWVKKEDVCESGKNVGDDHSLRFSRIEIKKEQLPL